MDVFLSFILPIVSLILGIIVIVLGFLAYSTDKKSIINRLFLGVTVFTFSWILTVIVRFSFFLGQNLIIWSARASFAVSTILTLFLYYFTYYFPITNKNYKLPVFIIVLVGIAISLLSLFTPFVVENIDIVDSIQYDTYGFVYYLFAVYFVLLLVASVFNLVSKRGYLDAVQKNQMYYVLVGFSLSAVSAFATNLLIPLITNITKIAIAGPALLIFFIIFTTYAIFKHHLFNIKIIATELLTFSIWIFILIQTLLADSTKNQFINGILLLLVIIFGIFLIKSVIREVEQREKLEVLTKELNATNERLVKLDKLKSEFLSFASHQVKTPITIVKGYASLIADGTYGQVSDKIKEIALRIVGASDRMVGLVNSILDSRKIEDGRMEYKFGEVEIVELVNNVVVDLKSVAERKGLIFNIELPNEKLIVKADENKFRQVVQNILDNAIKYTDQGWVEVELEKKNDSLLLSVSDSGRGISKELLPRIFDQWTRDSKIVRNIQGTGLGLYIAKEIVIAHGGEIWAESRGAGEGSTFYVRLKLLR